MKSAICTTVEDAKAIQSDDDRNARLPWPGVYLDGSPAPAGQGVTEHLYDITPHPKDAKWAYPVSDEAVSKGSADPLSKATVVDKLDATWAAAVEAPKEEPIEDNKPVDEFAVPVK